jgi:hypothetical protein
MRALLTEESTPVYASMEDPSITLATLHQDEEFEIGKAITRKRKAWVEVTLDSGVKGYISGEARIFGLRKVELVDASTEMHSEASSTSPVIKTLPRRTVFFTLRVEKTDEGGWVRVRDLTDTEGYISGKSKIRIIQPVTRAQARRMMLLGAAFLVIGSVFGYVSYLPENTGNTTLYYLSIGFIAFGALQLLQGFFQRREAIAQEKSDQNK